MSNNNTPTPEPASQPRPAALNPASAGQLANAFGRYLDLSEKLSSPVITPETEQMKSERAGLEKFLHTKLLTHAAELIGSWNVVHSEYEHILRSLAIVFRRIGVIPVEVEQPQPSQQTPQPNQEAK